MNKIMALQDSESAWMGSASENLTSEFFEQYDGKDENLQNAPQMSMHRWIDLDQSKVIQATDVADRYDHIDRNDVIVAVVYSVIGLFGIIGNLRVLLLLCRCFCSKSLAIYYRDQCHILSYVLCLCIVDTLVIIFLPVVIMDSLHNQWFFGQLFCRVFWTCESLNKIFSTFILVALSANCYVGVCRPTDYHYWRKMSVSWGLLAVCALLSAALISPIFLFSDVYGFGFSDPENKTVEIFLIKCIFHPPQQVQQFFTLYIVCFGFGITGLFQIVFYVLLVRFLYRHKQKTNRCRSRERKFWKVVKIVIMLVAFYFACWTPYWIITLHIYYSSPGGSESGIDKLGIYFVHALPYINSAVNPTLYSRLLTQKARTAYRATGSTTSMHVPDPTNGTACDESRRNSSRPVPGSRKTSTCTTVASPREENGTTALGGFGQFLNPTMFYSRLTQTNGSLLTMAEERAKEEIGAQENGTGGIGTGGKSDEMDKVLVDEHQVTFVVYEDSSEDINFTSECLL